MNPSKYPFGIERDIQGDFEDLEPHRNEEGPDISVEASNSENDQEPTAEGSIPQNGPEVNVGSNEYSDFESYVQNITCLDDDETPVDISNRHGQTYLIANLLRNTEMRRQLADGSVSTDDFSMGLHKALIKAGEQIVAADGPEVDITRDSMAYTLSLMGEAGILRPEEMDSMARMLTDVYRTQLSPRFGPGLIRQHQANQLVAKIRRGEPHLPGKNGKWTLDKMEADLARVRELLAPAVTSTNRRIRLLNPPERPVPVFTLAGQLISTAGNLTVISAQIKGGKSAVVGAMLAAALVADSGVSGADCLGFVASPTNGKALVLLDTEQSPFDAYKLVRRACDRVQWSGEAPENYRAHYTLDLSVSARLKFLKEELAKAALECGGIHSILIDGIGDLAEDVNDPKECNPLVDEIRAYSVQYDCPIITILHENPASQKFATGKTRGHLGSQLARKAESNLTIEKDAKGVSVISGERCRNAHLLKATGPRFAWSDELHRHVSYAAANPDEIRREAARPAAEGAFSGRVVMTYAALIASIMATGFSTSTAERRIIEWRNLELIVRADGNYSLNREI